MFKTRTPRTLAFKGYRLAMFTPDGSALLTTNDDGMLEMRDLARGDLRLPAMDTFGQARSVAFLGARMLVAGAKVVGLTISKEQRDFAQARIQAAGLADHVEIRLQDYRDERDQYDRIASIEMIEAVGEEFWPNYFSQLRDRLLPGGLAGIQAITIQDNLFQGYRRDVDFIQRYVFPGGMLPSPQILKSLGERFGVAVIRERIFGQDYAKTLATWRNNFRAAWPNLIPLGFDDRFRRLWEYYLAYCEAGFLSGNIDVRQVVFAKAK